MRRYLAVALAGLVFGVGLALSEMTHARKVLGFLDIAGAWDPSLLFVLGGAVCVTAVAFRFILRRPAPLLDGTFRVPATDRIDAPLLTGAAIVGVGWGIGGYCPGPGIALLAAPSWETWVFIPGLFVGAFLHKLIDAPAADRTATAEG